MQNGRLYPLDNLEHPTVENVGFVLPTPTANNSLRCTVEVGQKEAKRLHPQGRWTLWTKLSEMVILPTPLSRDYKNTPSTPSAWNRKTDLNVELAKHLGYTKQTIGKDARLNPHFVTWLMGFPKEWLD
jgi:hypothetical protein